MSLTYSMFQKSFCSWFPGYGECRNHRVSVHDSNGSYHKMEKTHCVVYFYFLYFSFVTGGDENEFEVQIVRYKPEAIDTLCEKSKFSRKELQIMYRGFKQVIKHTLSTSTKY